MQIGTACGRVEPPPLPLTMLLSESCPWSGPVNRHKTEAGPEDRCQTGGPCRCSEGTQPAFRWKAKARYPRTQGYGRTFEYG